MFVALNTIAKEQEHTTTTTMGDIVWLLKYAATHPTTTLNYHDSNMILHVASNTSYLYEEQARSRDGRHFFLADKLVKNGNKPPTFPTRNISIYTLCQLIKMVMSSAVEAEIGATFLNAKDTLPIRTTLKELGHP